MLGLLIPVDQGRKWQMSSFTHLSNWCCGILLYQAEILSCGCFQKRRLPWNNRIALLKWKGGRGSSQATSCRLKRDYSRWCRASTYTREAAIPGVIPGGMAPRPIPGRRRYQGLRQMLALVYTSHCLVYTRRSLITPVASWWGALLGSIDTSGAIPSSLAGRVWAWSAWLQGSGLGFSFCLGGVCDIQHRGWARSPVQSGCFRKGDVYL